MSHLHPSRWPGLEPEFDAADLLVRAEQALTGVSTHGAALARGYLQSALKSLHPATRNPEARKEFEGLRGARDARARPRPERTPE